jgi:hypothetical protein
VTIRPPHFIALLVVLIVMPGFAWADLPGPGPRPDRFRHLQGVPQMAAVPPPNTWRVQIEVSSAVTRPRLILPRPALEHVMERQQREHETIGGLPQLDRLLCAFVLAAFGLYLVRGRTRVALAACLLLVSIVSFCSPDSRVEAAPPASVKKLRLGELLLENVEIVIKAEHDDITLTLPPAVLTRLKLPSPTDRIQAGSE